MDKTFMEAINGIRSAVMASEVREDIAQGMEYVEQFANTATTKAAEAAASAAAAAESASNAGTVISASIDPTLSLSGKAADAKIVGKNFSTTMKWNGMLPSSTTKLSEFLNCGIFGISSDISANITDLPEKDRESYLTTSLTLKNNICENGYFVEQQLYSPKNFSIPWVRMLKFDGTVYRDWERSVKENAVYKNDLICQNRILAECLESGSYTYLRELGQPIDGPANVTLGIPLTLFNIHDAYAGNYTIQIIIDLNLKMYMRVVKYSDKSIFHDWIEINKNVESKILKGNYAALGDSRTNRKDIVIYYQNVIGNIKNYKSVNNWGVSGSTFVPVEGYDNALSIVKSHDFRNIDYVTINWGYNDQGRSTALGTPSDTGTNTVCGVLYNVCKRILAANPKCYILVVTPLVDKYGYTTKMQQYSEAIMETARINNIACVNPSTMGGLPKMVYSTFFNIDAVHSSDYTIFGKWLATYMP